MTVSTLIRCRRRCHIWDQVSCCAVSRANETGSVDVIGDHDALACWLWCHRRAWGGLVCFWCWKHWSHIGDYDLEGQVEGESELLVVVWKGVLVGWIRNLRGLNG